MPLKLPSVFVLHERAKAGSTNDEARNLANQGAGEGALVWAREQTGGRGRRGRSWVSPPGNLYCSVILKPDVALLRAAELGFVAALAIRAVAVDAIPSADVRLKWPNDVLANGAKISGILLEPLADRGIVLGMGVNVTSAPKDTPYPAAALADWGSRISVEAALESLAANLWDLYQLWKSHGFRPIREMWLTHAKGLGQRIEVRLEDRTLTGLFEGIDEQGALLLDNGQRVLAGDVFFPGA